MDAVIDGKHYRVEFSYRRRRGTTPSLGRSAPIEAVSVCAIVCDDAPKIVAVQSAVCGQEDFFSRPRGRREAFLRTVNSCGILRSQTQLFTAWFNERFPEPAKAPLVPRERLSPGDKETLRNSGEGIRTLRQEMRKESTAG